LRNLKLSSERADLQRFTNQKPLEHEYNQLLERLEREEGDLAEFSTQRAEVMQQSEERFRSIFDQSPVGVYIFDKEFKITQWNERIIQILGSSYDRIVGLDTKEIKDQNLIPAMRKALTGEFCNEERLYEATDSAAKL
jgi:PAS domain-containing protein